jgi:hypothetical protein
MVAAKGREGDLRIEVVSEKQAEEHLKELYANPDAAREFFDGYIGRRQQAINGFADTVNQDEELAKAFQDRPLGILRERNLLGPFDHVRLDYVNFHPDLWWHFCHPVCRLVPRVVVEWICVTGPWGLRLCFPRLRVIWVWECRIVCF